MAQQPSAGRATPRALPDQVAAVPCWSGFGAAKKPSLCADCSSSGVDGGRVVDWGAWLVAFGGQAASGSASTSAEVQVAALDKRHSTVAVASGPHICCLTLGKSSARAVSALSTGRPVAAMAVSWPLLAVCFSVSDVNFCLVHPAHAPPEGGRVGEQPREHLHRVWSQGEEQGHSCRQRKWWPGRHVQGCLAAAAAAETQVLVQAS